MIERILVEIMELEEKYFKLTSFLTEKGHTFDSENFDHLLSQQTHMFKYLSVLKSRLRTIKMDKFDAVLMINHEYKVKNTESGNIIGLKDDGYIWYLEGDHEKEKCRMDCVDWNKKIWVVV